MRIRNTFIIFLVSGFWHGANWTFIVWGFLNALYILPSIISRTNRNHLEIVAKGRLLPTAREFLSIAVTFGLTLIAWIFFRSDSVGAAFKYLSTIFSPSLFTVPFFNEMRRAATIGILVIIFIIIEWMGREEQYAIAKLALNSYRPIRWALYFAIVLVIFNFAGNEQEFIYFQF